MKAHELRQCDACGGPLRAAFAVRGGQRRLHRRGFLADCAAGLARRSAPDLPRREELDRGDRARVFDAANKIIEAAADVKLRRYGHAALVQLEMPWLVALTDPRAALCGLLDLLEIPLPTQEQQ